MNPRFSHTLIRFSISFFSFNAGFCGLAFEYTFSKFAADMLGNSPQQWAITIGIMFLAMGLGSDHQKKIKDADVLKKFYLYEWLLSLIGGLGPLFMLSIFSLDRLHYMVIQYICVFFVGFVIGMEIPILLRLNSRHQSTLSLNLATILRFDYFGGFVGALVWAFLLLRFLPSMIESALVLGMLNLTSSFLLVGVIRLNDVKYNHAVPNWLKWPKIALLSFLLLMTILMGTLFFSENMVTPLEQKLFKDRVVASKTTAFQHIVITENPHGMVHCYINGQLQFSSIDEHIYHETLVHPAMLMSKKRENILILGGGDGLALREALKYDEVKKITLVDIDSAMIRLAGENKQLVRLNKNAFQNAKVFKKIFSPSSTGTYQNIFWDNFSHFPTRESEKEKIAVYIIDARLFLQEINELYDVVIIDFPDPQNIELSKLYALSFYRMLSKKLKKKGIIVQQSTSPLLTPKTFLLIGKTIEQAGFKILPLRAGVPSFGEWGFWLAEFSPEDFVENNNPNNPPYKQTNKNKQLLRNHKLLTRFLALEKSKTLEKMSLRYLSSETWKIASAFPPNALNKSFLPKKKQINTIVNGIIWKNYLKESDQY